MTTCTGCSLVTDVRLRSELTVIAGRHGEFFLLRKQAEACCLAYILPSEAEAESTCRAAIWISKNLALSREAVIP